MLSQWTGSGSFFNKEGLNNKKVTFSCKVGQEIEKQKDIVLGCGVFKLHSGIYSPNSSKISFGNGFLTKESFSLHEESEVSIFLCSNESDFASAISAIKQLKSLKHPLFPKYIDALLPTDPVSSMPREVSEILLATERVIPLLTHLKEFNEGQKEKEESLLKHVCTKQQLSKLQDIKHNYFSFGIYQVIKGISFLNQNGLVHGALHSGCIFVTPSNQWKIYGLEQTTSNKDTCHNEKIGAPKTMKWPDILSQYQPPERKLLTFYSGVNYDILGDSWGIGCIIWEVFNGLLSNPKNLSNTDNIPINMQDLFKQLLCKLPNKRPEAFRILENFKVCFKNPLIYTMNFFEEFNLQTLIERSKFFSELSDSKLDGFPDNISKGHILSELLKICNYNLYEGAEILTPLLAIGRRLENEEFEKSVVPCLMSLFSSKSRSVRYKLLCHIEQFACHLTSKRMTNIFPHIESGFKDKDWRIREKTVISLIYLAPKLNFQQLDNAVIKTYFPTLLMDENNTVRTNATVTLGKIAPYLHYNTRQAVLISAFGKKTLDLFVPARIAALQAIAATHQYYTIIETSSKVLPILCRMTTDIELNVRILAFKIMKGFLEKLEQVSTDQNLREEMEAEIQVTRSEFTNKDMVTSAKTWASWAAEALSAKLYKSDPPSSSTKKQTIVECSSPKEEKSFPISKKKNSPIEQTITDQQNSKVLETDLINLDISVKNCKVNDWGDWDENNSDDSDWGNIHSTS